MKIIKNSFVITIIIVVIAAAGAFYGGLQYQKSKPTSQTGGQGQAGTLRRGNGQGFRATRGTILNMDDKSLTVKLQDGSSKIIILSDKTAFIKSDKAEKTDLKTGDTVAIFGTDNSDGSVTAQDVQLNPTGGFGGTRQ